MTIHVSSLISMKRNFPQEERILIAAILKSIRFIRDGKVYRWDRERVLRLDLEPCKQGSLESPVNETAQKEEHLERYLSVRSHS